jgi:hypothetical protein
MAARCDNTLYVSKYIKYYIIFFRCQSLSLGSYYYTSEVEMNSKASWKDTHENQIHT